MHPLVRRIVARRAFQVGVGLMALYALLGFLLLPYVVEHTLPNYVRDSLQRQASIGAVRFNPFLLSLEAEDFKLNEADGEPIAAFRRLFIDFETSSLFHWAWTFKTIRAEGLDLHVERRPQGDLNLGALIDSFPKDPAAAKANAGPVRLLLWEVALIDGRLHYVDLAGNAPASVTVMPVNVELKEIAILPNRRGPVTLNATLDGGGTLALLADLSLQPLDMTGSLTLKGFPAATAWPFLRDYLRLAEFKGVIDLDGGFSVKSGKDATLVSLRDIHLHTEGLDIREQDARAPLLALKTLDAPGARIDLNQHTVTLPQLALADGQFSLSMDRQGKVNWGQLTVRDTGPPPAGAKPALPVAAVSPPVQSPSTRLPDDGSETGETPSIGKSTETSPSVGSASGEPVSADKSTEPSPSAELSAAESNPADASSVTWRVMFDKVELSNIAVEVADNSRPVPLTLAIAQLGATLKLGLDIGAATTVSADTAGIDLAGLALQLQGEESPALTLDSVHLSDGKIDTDVRTVAIGQLTLNGGGTRLLRDTDGKLHPIDALAGTVADTTAQSGTPAVKPDASPWHYRVGTLQLQAFKAGLADQGYEPPLAVDLEEIEVTLKDVMNDGKTPLQFDTEMKVVQGGNVNAAGTLAADRKSARGNLIVDKVDLIPLQALIAAHTTLALKTGAASVAAEWEYAAHPDTDPVFTAGGTASIDDLLLNEIRSGERFYACKSVSVSGLEYKSAPAGLNVADVRVIEPDVKVLIFPDRTLNLIKAFEKSSPDRQSETSVTTAETDAGRLPIRIARVRVERGKVDYTDQSLVLPFATEIRDFHGTVTGVSSDPVSHAEVDLQGRVEQYGSAKVSGTLNPFAPKRHMDIHTEFRNVEMPRLSPYSATFAGREIATGKLSLDLEYKIDDGELAGDNQVMLDHFTLGKKVDSKDALDLPLDLAVALLTDTNGRIDLAVPVSGNVDKPDFAIGKVVGQAIKLVLTRIVTAPFRALGSLLGSGEEQINTIAFSAGSAQLAPPQLEKLKQLTNALAQRPQLKLIVTGRYDAKLDGAALRTEHVRHAVSAELGIALDEDARAAPVVFDEARTQGALEDIYKARLGDDALDAFQAQYEAKSGQKIERVNPVFAVFGKPSPDHAFYADLYRELVRTQTLADSELRDLADKRAEAISQALVQEAGLASERIESTAPKAVDKSAKQDVEATLDLSIAK